MSGYGISALGTYGLENPGTYTSYDPYMMGMMGSPYGAMAMGYGMGSIFNPATGYNTPMMRAMYDPLYYGQMQAQMETNQAMHKANMHDLLLNTEVAAHRSTNQATISKIMTDATVQQGVINLYNKVREGDQDGICQQFDLLKNLIYNNYRDHFQTGGASQDSSTAAAQVLEALYYQIVSSSTQGKDGDLRADIKKYGDNAVKNGFMKGFREGHHDRYVDETLHHCFGLNVDQKSSKDSRQHIATGFGKTARALEKGALGAGIGIGACGAAALITAPFSTNVAKWWIKSPRLRWLGGLGAIAGIGASIYHQTTGRSLFPQRA